MICSRCGGRTPEGKRFCKDCGAPLGTRCPGCGAETIPASRFCADCGTPLEEAAAPGSAPSESRTEPAPAAGLKAEMRHVSVLFCDLVDFTPLSESRDPADMREFLSGYFEMARSVVGRYGGVIEKFIGDAVMAVWGVPVANEDDAERAVRAGLELLDGIAEYGESLGTALQGRVGIVTGRAATAASQSEGLVVGDRVNTAARIQSVAPAGSCYVDETTRSATSAAIAYEDAGSHQLKGKAEPAHLYRALRVEAAIAGSQRPSVIEAPFTGREYELRLLKELLHASIERSSARLALVSGVAGIGKSRLAWELFKYVDGIAQELLWHTGHCLSYGDGVSYRALSEMVRARLQIGEEDSHEVAAERLKTGLERWIQSPEDREFIAPRLAQLLGIPTDHNLMRQELFAGWRLFFERLAEHLPVVMVLEDLQWADPGLVEFLDQLLDWSADHAIFLLVLTRPEGIDRAASMLSRRNTTNLSLDPLPDEVVARLLDSLVENLPADARARIVERAEGIPLYALETIRALIDRGAIARGEAGLRVTDEIGTLDVPPELTALISSRLDTLAPKERQLVKECAVLGDAFPRHAVEAVSDLEAYEIDSLLATLVRREVLTVRADKLSPERGQYAFTQSLIRQVAYEMLTTAERKARHLRTAQHLEQSFASEGIEAAEVIASHLHDAYLAAGSDPDAEEIRRRAERAAVAAAERAGKVGANERAAAAYLRAADLAAVDKDRGEHLVKAARMSNEMEDHAATIAHANRARQLFEAIGEKPGIAAAELARALGVYFSGSFEEASQIIRAAIDLTESVELDPLLEAELYTYHGAACAFTGRYEESRQALDRALLLAQQHELEEELVIALNFRSMVLRAEGRHTEARLYLEASVAAVEEGSRLGAILENNLGWSYAGRDLPAAEEHLRKALAIARRRGSRMAEAASADSLISVLMAKGSFTEAAALIDEVIDVAPQGRFGNWTKMRLASLKTIYGETDGARQLLVESARERESDELQNRSAYLWIEALVRLAGGEAAAALESVDDFREVARLEGNLGEDMREAIPVAVEAAIALGTPERAEPLLAEVGQHPPGVLPPSVKLQLRRGWALLRAAAGETEGIEQELRQVEAGFAELGYEYWRARTALDLAEHLSRQGRTEQAHEEAAGAAEAFARIGALPMRERADKLVASLSHLVSSS